MKQLHLFTGIVLFFCDTEMNQIVNYDFQICQRPIFFLYVVLPLEFRVYLSLNQNIL